MKKILVINGHPDIESFCAGLAKSYKKGAESTKADCKLVNLADLNFNPNLQYGYRQPTELEPDLLKMQQDIINSQHLVFVYPTWWGTYPALLKGFVDRVFLPKFAFKFNENSPIWDKLLKGKSARLIVTMNSPKWFYSLIYKSSGHNSMKKSVLGFCGVAPVKITTLSPIITSTDAIRQNWLNQVEKLGEKQI